MAFSRTSSSLRISAHDHSRPLSFSVTPAAAAATVAAFVVRPFAVLRAAIGSWQVLSALRELKDRGCLPPALVDFPAFPLSSPTGIPRLLQTTQNRLGELVVFVELFDGPARLATQMRLLVQDVACKRRRNHEIMWT